jgi:hypothetical protein
MLSRYAPNPLRTVIELNDSDRERLRLKIEIEELEERVCGANFHLEPGERFDPAAALRALDVVGLEDTPRRKRIAELAGVYEAEMMHSHAADCTCFPSPCVKCHAEGMVGVDTIAGLGKPLPPRRQHADCQP